MRLSSRVAALAAAILAIMLVSSCSSSSPSGADGASGASGGTTAPTKLFDTDFKGVCSGATVSRARPYNKAISTGHKVVYFASYKDDLIASTADLPADWAVLFDANTDAFAATDLVACAVRTGDTFLKDCDGYTKDDKPTKNVAKLHTATYKLTVHEATTGNALGSTELAGTDETCPMFLTFDSDTDTVDYYASPPSDQVVAFVKPFAQPLG